jgi:hypothetical protein
MCQIALASAARAILAHFSFLGVTNIFFQTVLL